MTNIADICIRPELDNINNIDNEPMYLEKNRDRAVRRKNRKRAINRRYKSLLKNYVPIEEYDDVERLEYENKETEAKRLVNKYHGTLAKTSIAEWDSRHHHIDLETCKKYESGVEELKELDMWHSTHISKRTRMTCFVYKRCYGSNW